ncbi:MAG TPA: 4Fe-4S dicluster domain-containing protein, partial [Usitatibacter sp.]|nr:4Fe-4S dicluster domain-containing protein [Usitatibacter sp.]
PVELTRRDFLKLSAAAAALAGAGCTRPAEPIVPYAQMPEHALPGLPQFFATAMPLGVDAEGLLVESSTGRPIKAEGNPRHPSSLGGTSIHGQASILQLWDPDRSQAPRLRGRPAPLGELTRAVLEEKELRILVGTVTSPTLLAQLDALRKNGARVYSWDPLHRANSLEGARVAFGASLMPIYDFEKAGAVLSLDCDFLSGLPGRLRYARQFAASRKREARSRLYVLESTPTLAGAMADHRYAMRLSEIEEWLLGSPLLKQTIVKDLKANHGVVVPGEALAPWAHALVHKLNREIGAPVSYVESPEGRFDGLSSLVEDMQKGSVKALLILGGNPVYDAPADLDFAGALAKVPLSIHHGLYFDETAAACTWHLPATHFLEHWSDVRAFDGTASVVQPLIAPLYDAISPHRLLSSFLDREPVNDYQRVKERWSARWEDSLRKGVVEGSAFPAARPSLKDFPLGKPDAAPLEVRFVPDPNLRDGAFANNAWLQELPKPHTKLTWDNAALLGAATARELGLSTGDVVEIASGSRKIEAPAWILPGHAEKTITLPLGYGRAKAGRVGSRVGFDAYRLKTDSWAAEASLRKTGRRHLFATTQNHSKMEGRDLSRLVAFSSISTLEKERPQPSLYPAWSYDGYRWAMAIDLDACIGCNACTIACQAENNIPTVGKEQVIAGREMHWIRVDRYFEGPEAKPRTLFQPVPCMHCENAPCEEVCPVGATLHDSEGLNLQVYNRCVGTRFCSQNCPYKVRRFNFLEYSKKDESLKAQKNPEVTVRMRGVMEKCTYCIQRITRARIGADRENRRLGDGEVVTACQEACPTRAITFGDLNDPKSAVNEAKASPLHYTLLHELNTRPRTTYLARVANPNPDLEETG